MKKLVLLALFALLASPILADAPADLAAPALGLDAASAPVVADTACPVKEIELAPLAWEIDTPATATLNCGGRSCLNCTMCCNAACGWPDPCIEACWQQHCSSTCP
jgi:hypothetical protein